MKGREGLEKSKILSKISVGNGWEMFPKDPISTY
jgi:hypothetical protein